jgi:uncharacterized protein YndB with AHSA1/START domain
MAINTSTIIFHASKQKVWEALTNPEYVKLWQYGSKVTTDWQPGSSIRFKAVWNCMIFEQWGTVLEMIPNELIRYNLFAPRPDLEDKPENYFVMSYILTPEGENTKLEIIQEDNRPGAQQEEPHDEENPVLQALKNVVDTI